MPSHSFATDKPVVSDTAVSGSTTSRVWLFGRVAAVLSLLMVANSVLLFSGMLGDVAELEALFADNSLPDSLVVMLGAFLAQPILSLHLLVGIYWLVFHTILPTRAGIVLRKMVFASTEAIHPQPAPSAHGCRAPPFRYRCLFA
ncbi:MULTISPECIES: hypothetical protein [Pseudoalteromonas]|uniref:Uncharacterized protein n=1 Tax=Pseudoalteromonas peptidolytica F12-50-A1 TaxID=1315280 RepID=A0A8I0T4F5_9GAMM|nr:MULTISPECIES: hypothetical protein [Pseudoalteromonas]MBE0346143.1 hypothetical protein [Pseudoalteromonas peptidolytica F12-50-A1]MDW7548227.1 hypothetical protein [Pseudoalteromonas peptidolytica]GEK11754.1 hypothetical protein PPE03_40030 [Pseudoalteromonas peptidolytica]